MAILTKGPFTSNAGLKLLYKIEADGLVWEDIETIVLIVQELFPYKFSRVVSVPRGGDRIAQAISYLGTGDSFDPVLVVDDVLTTGGSLLRKIQEIKEETGETCIDLVIFARGILPEGVYALFQVSDWAR